MIIPYNISALTRTELWAGKYHFSDHPQSTPNNKWGAFAFENYIYWAEYFCLNLNHEL